MGEESSSAMKGKSSSATGIKACVKNPLISVIMPVYNAMPFLTEALDSVLAQTYSPLELSVFVDGKGNEDGSYDIINSYKDKFVEKGVSLVCSMSEKEKPGGCGASCNAAIKQSSGSYLCFLDADDTMKPTRVKNQLLVAKDKNSWVSYGTSPQKNNEAHVIVGCNLYRTPENSTPRYVDWLNRIKDEQLVTQRFRECTIAKPTWFMPRATFDYVGQFDDCGPVMYRYHTDAQSLSIPWRTILEIRVRHIEKHVIDDLDKFAIWGAGKFGKRFFRLLTPTNQDKVVCFCDVKQSLIDSPGFYYDKRKMTIPVVHWTDLKITPVITCVKLDMGCTGGFEENLKSLNLVEGEEFWYFS